LTGPRGHTPIVITWHGAADVASPILEADGVRRQYANAAPGQRRPEGLQRDAGPTRDLALPEMPFRVVLMVYDHAGWIASSDREVSLSIRRA